MVVIMISMSQPNQAHLA